MKTYLVPVHVDPVKPMNPSHLRHILYVDFLYRQFKALGHDVVYLYNRVYFDVSNQVVKLAKFLESRKSKVETSLDIGLQYIQMTSERFEIDADTLYEERAQQQTHLHGYPYYSILLEDWKREHELLDVFDPGFRSPRRIRLTVQEVSTVLNDLGVIFDARRIDGNIYLDLTPEGLPMRKIIGVNEYSYNYLFIVLRELFEYVKKGDEVYFVFDPDLSLDYELLKRVLKKYGCHVFNLTTSRISLGGKIQSARKGGWQGYTTEDILHRYTPRFSSNSIGLAIRHYLLAKNAVHKQFDFSYDEFEKSFEFAQAVEKKYGSLSFSELIEKVYSPPLTRSFNIWSTKIEKNKSNETKR